MAYFLIYPRVKLLTLCKFTERLLRTISTAANFDHRGSFKNRFYRFGLKNAKTTGTTITAI